MEPMGNKKISLMLVIVLLLSIFVVMLNGSATGLNQNQQRGSRTPDHDNSFGDATDVTQLGKAYDGSVDANDDPFDFYKIYLSKTMFNGDLLTFNLTINESFGGAIFLRLFNNEKYEIGSDIVYGSKTSDYIRSFIASRRGDHYIVIGAIEFIPSVKYNISFSKRTDFTSLDNDNTNSSATQTTSGNSYPSTLNSTYDYLDLYYISMDSGATSTEALTVELSGYDGIYLAVYSPDGTLRERSDIIYGSPGDKETIKFAADQTGNYRIAVGISLYPKYTFSYILTVNVTSDVAPDTDYDEEHATRVYDGTELDSAFDSMFDLYDYYVIELNTSDKLTVSILYENGGPGDLDIEIYETETDESITNTTYSDTNKGIWAWGIALNDNTDYFIRVENLDTDILVNYTILFSLNGRNLWYKPIEKNDTNLDFSMQEDSQDASHVNLTHIFYDPDSPITFDSPSHPNGIGNYINITILANKTVEFRPHQDFYGYEIVNFSATDDTNNKSYWEVNVTVLPVNDPPVVASVSDQEWRQGVEAHLTLAISDVDDTEFTIYDNTTLFDVNQTTHSIRFTPTNDQVGVHYININVSDSEYNTSLYFTAAIMNENDAPVFEKIHFYDANPIGFIELSALEDTWNNFSVSASDIDHLAGVKDVLTFSSNITDSAFSIDSKTGNVSFFPLQKHVGTFFVKLMVKDDNNSQAQQNINITVLNRNDAPAAPIITLENVTGLSVNCSVDDVFDEDGDQLSYLWDFGDGSAVQTGLNVNHTYDKPDNYTIEITVDDGNGGISTDTFYVNLTSVIIDDGTDNDTDNDIDDDTKPIVDEDNDGLDDYWELLYFTNLSQGPDDDFDGDGFTNLQEFTNESNPVNKDDKPKDDDSSDKKVISEVPSGMETILLVAVIGVLVNFILLIIILYMVIKKRSRAEVDDHVSSRVPEDSYSIPCPECGRMVPGDRYECPYCGEQLDLDYEEYPERGRGHSSSRSSRSRRDDGYYEDDWTPEDEGDAEFYDDEDEYEDYYDEAADDDTEWDEDEYDEEYDEEEYDEDDYEDEDDTDWDDDEDEEEYDEDDYEDEDDTDWERDGRRGRKQDYY